VLVDDLLFAVPFQQDTKRVKTSDHALQPDAIGEEDRDWRSSALEVIEECVLKPVDIVFRHGPLDQPTR
jgi:hypothetical protein